MHNGHALRLQNLRLPQLRKDLPAPETLPRYVLVLLILGKPETSVGRFPSGGVNM